MIILASASASRRAMLDRAGIPYVAAPVNLDEDAIKTALRADGCSAADVAVALANMKAQRASQNHPDALVLGSDQMMDCQGIWPSKPTSIPEARQHLQVLRGKTHRLFSAAALVRDGRRLWHHVDHADLTMWDFSDSVLDAYLDRMGPDVTQTLGAYKLESGGAPLFSRVSGDPFVVQGMPLLAVLSILREHGIQPS